MDKKTLCKRKSDGAFFEPSYPDDYNSGKAMADCMLGNARFYFREVVWKPCPLWKFWHKGIWERTGVIWQPDTGEFDVLSEPK